LSSRTRFKVVTAVYNCLEWLPYCLSSISRQNYPHFDLCLVDDASNEEGLSEFAESTCRRLGWEYLRREENGGCLAATVDAIRHLNPNDQDVIVTIDGDDWLYHDRVFERVDWEYRKRNVEMTYGQCLVYPRGWLGLARPYTLEQLEGRDFRVVEPRWTHLRTFRAHLWQRIRDADLRTPYGQYYRYATDHAFMNPLLEMASPHIGCIRDILYVYNTKNTNSESATSRFLQIATRYHIRQLPRYPCAPVLN
jgi:glycosyltransferase involved in cell wall biosynthesis